MGFLYTVFFFSSLLFLNHNIHVVSSSSTSLLMDRATSAQRYVDGIFCRHELRAPRSGGGSICITGCSERALCKLTDRSKAGLRAKYGVATTYVYAGFGRVLEAFQCPFVYCLDLCILSFCITHNNVSYLPPYNFSEFSSFNIPH